MGIQKNRGNKEKGRTNVLPIPINKIKTTNMIYLRKYIYVNMDTGDMTDKIEEDIDIKIIKKTKAVKYGNARTTTTITVYYTNSRQLELQFPTDREGNTSGNSISNSRK